MKVEVKFFIDGEECELEDLPTEHLLALEQKCQKERVSIERIERAFKLLAEEIDLYGGDKL